jgi:DNA-binding transcriptional LysR family regulator
VSQQLKRLEELFGTELFERHHKRLALRSTGERLYSTCAQADCAQRRGVERDERAGLRGRGAARRDA